MNKPKNYDNTLAIGEFEAIELGGHKLEIMQVEECKTMSGSDYIKVSFDTTRDDKQPRYYNKQYQSDTREPRKWGGTKNIFVLDQQGNTSRAFKTFCTSVEHSNAGFQVQWGQNFCSCFKNKLVGGVFGEEEYKDVNGVVKVARKLQLFRGINGIQEVEVPKKRTLLSYQQPNNARIVEDSVPEFANFQNRYQQSSLMPSITDREASSGFVAPDSEYIPFN